MPRDLQYLNVSGENVWRMYLKSTLDPGEGCERWHSCDSEGLWDITGPIPERSTVGEVVGLEQ